MAKDRKRKKEKLKIKKMRTELSLLKAQREEAQFIFDECREEFGEHFTTKKQKSFNEKKQKEKGTKDSSNEGDKEEENGETGISTDVREGGEDGGKESEHEGGGEADNIDEIESVLQDKDMKDMFKKIALKTHPDRLDESLSDEEREEKIEIYKLAAAASKDGDGGALLDIAYELNIDIEISPLKEEKWLKKKIKQINKTVIDIQQDVRWIWFHTNEKSRDRVEELIEKQTIFTKK